MSNSISRVEHTAIVVSDIRWYVQFFEEVFGMRVTQVDGDPESPRQIWFDGGLQLIENSQFDGPEGRLGHLGIIVQDLGATLAAMAKWGSPLGKGPNWFKLPDGLCIEVMEGRIEK